LVPKRNEKHCNFFIYPTSTLVKIIFTQPMCTVLNHTRLWWQKSSFLNSKTSLKLTECAKAITFLVINDRSIVLRQSLMVYFGTECIVYIFLHIFQCMVINNQSCKTCWNFLLVKFKVWNLPQNKLNK
jgi:hypothetical protein